MAYKIKRMNGKIWALFLFSIILISMFSIFASALDLVDISICNTADTIIEAGYTANLQFNHSDYVSEGLSLANGDDIRITYNGVELDRVLAVGSDWNTPNTNIQFEVQTAIGVGECNGNYRMHYDDPTATNPPVDVSKVFYLADSFNDGNLNTKWDAFNEEGFDGNSVEFDGRLYVYDLNSGGGNSLMSKVGRENLYVDFVDLKLHANERIVFGLGNGTVGLYSMRNNLFGTKQNGNYVFDLMSYPSISQSSRSSPQDEGQNFSFAIDNRGSQSFWEDNSRVFVTDNGTIDPTTPQYISFEKSDAWGGVTNLSVDEVRARIYTTPEPISTVLSSHTPENIEGYGSTNPYVVTMNWIIPSDTTFTVALAGAETTIDFNPINKSSLEVQADSQADVTPIVTITNQGNILADYSAEVTGTLPSWVTLKGKNSYDYSTADTLSNSTNITIQANVEGGDTAEYWLWSDFTSAPKGTEESSFQISTLETP